jgi:hypothetical protein
MRIRLASFFLSLPFLLCSAVRGQTGSLPGLSAYLAAPGRLNGGVLAVDTTCALFADMTARQMDSLKRADSSAFYVIADDWMYYRANVIAMLEKNGIGSVTLPDSIRYVKISDRKTGKSWTLDLRKPDAIGGARVLYKAGKQPKPFAELDLTPEDVQAYFKN